MPLTSGNRLGSYEIIAPLGAGGMGEVYRARDTKLGREVALKVLPAAFAQDAERMARFQREAQVLASLNHPNIASIYGLEESGITRALVMELVEGQTLAERIAGAHPLTRPSSGGSPSPQGRGAGGEGVRPSPLPLDETLTIAKQIAEALEFAHERGIIHRDLKPANVKVTHDGAVKVLDFGLAKALSTEDSGTNITHSPTISIAATQAGMILGTAAYMSPEQAKGKTVDRRADIWAFGCVLYEMLTGTRTFEGETTSDVLAAVIRAEPDWNELPQSTPPSIRKLLWRCLQKDPKQRLRDIGDARIAIEETLSGAPDVGATLGSPWAGQAPPLPQPIWRRALPWATAGIFPLAAILITIAYWRLAQAPTSALISEIPAPAKAGFLFTPQNAAVPQLSPDGTRLVFLAGPLAKPLLWVRSLDSTEAKPLAGTENAFAPFWSPDDRSIGFFAGGKLKKIAVSGGPPVDVCDATTFGRGGSWAPDGTILF